MVCCGLGGGGMGRTLKRMEIMDRGTKGREGGRIG